MSQAGSVDLDTPTVPVTSRSARFALLAAGHTCVGLGVIGIFLPVMPTTVFLIVAASCYARASTRFYEKLLAHRVFGPILRDWHVHRAMTARSKVLAISAIVVAFGATLVFAVDRPWVRVIHLATATVLVGVILAIRTRRTSPGAG